MLGIESHEKKSEDKLQKATKDGYVTTIACIDSWRVVGAQGATRSRWKALVFPAYEDVRRDVPYQVEVSIIVSCSFASKQFICCKECVQLYLIADHDFGHFDLKCSHCSLILRRMYLLLTLLCLQVQEHHRGDSRPDVAGHQRQTVQPSQRVADSMKTAWSEQTRFPPKYGLGGRRIFFVLFAREK